MKSSKKGIANILVILIILAISTALSTTLIRVAENIIPQIDKTITVQSKFSNNEITITNTQPIGLPLKDIKIFINDEEVNLIDSNRNNIWDPFEDLQIIIPPSQLNKPYISVEIYYKNKLIYSAFYVKPEVIKGDHTPPKIIVNNKNIDVNQGRAFWEAQDDNGVVEYGIQFGYINGSESKPVLKKIITHPCKRKKISCFFSNPILKADYLYSHEVVCLILYAKDVAGNPSRVIIPINPPKISTTLTIIPLYPAQWIVPNEKIRIPSQNNKASVKIIINAQSKAKIKKVKLTVNGAEAFSKDDVNDVKYAKEIQTTLTLGTNKILLEITNNYGIRKTVEKDIQVVKDKPPLIKTFDVLPGKGCIVVNGKILYGQPFIPVKFQINATDDNQIKKVTITIDGNTIYATMPRTKSIDVITNEYRVRGGKHTAKLEVYDDYDQANTTTITFETDYDKPPEITFTPTSEYARPSGRDIQFTATATDDYGLKSISVTINGKTFTKDAQKPYPLTLTISDSVFLTPKTYTVTVKAKDLFRETTKTFTLIIKTDNPPQVQITKPTLGQTFIGTKTIEITAFAIDDREVKSITIYVDNKKIGTTQPNAKSYTFTKKITLDYGDHYAYAEACDVFGCTKSKEVIFYIKEDRPPYVKITSPYNGQTFEIMTNSISIPITVYARDDLKVTQITVKIDGRTIKTQQYSSSVATIAMSYSLSVGTHTITATAEDSSGKKSSDSVTITIKRKATPPQIKSFSIPEIGWSKTKDNAYVIGD